MRNPGAGAWRYVVTATPALLELCLQLPWESPVPAALPSGKAWCGPGPHSHKHPGLSQCEPPWAPFLRPCAGMLTPGDPRGTMQGTWRGKEAQDQDLSQQKCLCF